MQQSFSRLWDGFKSDKEAMLARNVVAKTLKKKGFKVRKFMLKNQLKKYDGFACDNGGICNVYFLEIKD